jgi:LmbE family N-acetylglucosaminyl deacetylase
MSFFFDSARYNLFMLRLMCVTAHPDDEAGNFGGTLRFYADKGVETCVICLTPGQAASNRGSAKTDQELAEIRRKEFAASCEILKVSRAIVLDYPDGKLHRQDLYRIVCALTLHIRRFRPHVLITYAADGGITGHTDHSMAGIFATLAFQWAARNNRFPDQLDGSIAPHQTQKLYYSSASFVLPDRPPIAPSPFTAVIDVQQYIETKIAAFKAHLTQSPLWPILENNVRKREGLELFHLAASTRPGPIVQETDLFAGVSENDQVISFEVSAN